MMAVVPKCPICKVDDATEEMECNVSGCAAVEQVCPVCLSKFQCEVCEFAYCDTHRTKCSVCSGVTCAYCARKLPADSRIFDLNCFDVATSSLIETDIIASCPLVSTLPEPDDSIFDDFDPPIEMITYSQSKTAAKRGVRPHNVQAEHFVPNSCFIVGTGRTGAVVKGSGLYSEGKALTYWVDDDQKAGTEHKFLTDLERAFCQECENNGQYPTLKQWLDFMQHATSQSILNHRDYTGDTTGMSDEEIANVTLKAANEAAFAVRYQMQEHFVNVLKANLSAYLGNGIVGGLAPPKKVSKAERYDL